MPHAPGTPETPGTTCIARQILAKSIGYRKDPVHANMVDIEPQAEPNISMPEDRINRLKRINKLYIGKKFVTHLTFGAGGLEESLAHDELK